MMHYVADSSLNASTNDSIGEAYSPRRDERLVVRPMTLRTFLETEGWNGSDEMEKTSRTFKNFIQQGRSE